MTFKRPKTSFVLGLILLLGLALRLLNVGFGLPAMYDPDEPLFILKAFKLLDDQTLNPGWFGHPGSTTIYLLAMVDMLVVAIGLASGRFASLPEFAAAVYAHPGLIFVPSRLAMVLISVGTIWLTFLLGRRLAGGKVGLVAAGFLALNALHVAWSQVVRTDIHASFFMLASLIFAARAAVDGRLRDFILAGLLVGFAMATKWPAGAVFVAVVGAAAQSSRLPGNPAAARQLLSAVAATLVGLLVASPFILLDWATVVANVGGEVASGHLGHSGAGFLPNLGFFLGQLVATMGWVGLGLTIIGLGLLGLHPIARVTLLPAALLFLVVICSQEQIWSRWLTPALPMLCIAAALAAVSIVRWIAARTARRLRTATAAVIVTLLFAPSVAGAIGGARERATDTRDLASAWAREHIPAGSTVVVEHLALDLRPQPWRILFPIGAAGCVDGRQVLKAGVRYEDVQKARQGRPIVDLGNVADDRLDSCRADYAILTYFDLYLAESNDFPDQIKTYRQLLGSGRTVALFRPRAGRVGGPVTRIVALSPQASEATRMGGSVIDRIPLGAENSPPS